MTAPNTSQVSRKRSRVACHRSLPERQKSFFDKQEDDAIEACQTAEKGDGNSWIHENEKSDYKCQGGRASQDLCERHQNATGDAIRLGKNVLSQIGGMAIKKEWVRHAGGNC